MNPREENIWPKQITVDKRIVGILSQSTYETFPNAIREIVVNSYDADASRVDIEVDEKNERITIKDNGSGMTEAEFEFFLRIAGRGRNKAQTTQSGRYIIGKFGVGFLAVFPFFKNFSLETTKSGFDMITYASIPTFKYFKDDRIEIGEIEIPGKVRILPDKKTEQFTQITLSGFSSLTKNFFKKAIDRKPRRNSIEKLTGIEKLKWVLSEDLPLDYDDEKFNVLTKMYSPNLPFQVWFNNSPLTRKVLANTLLEVSGEVLKFEVDSYSSTPLAIGASLEPYEVGGIKFHYFITTDRKTVNPSEARHFKKRLLNAGVGKRDAFGFFTKVGGGRSRFNWLTGEVHFLLGQNDLVNVARDDFHFNPAYERVKDFLRDRLVYHSNRLESEAFIKNETQTNKIKRIGFLASAAENTNQNIVQESPEKIGYPEKSNKPDRVREPSAKKRKPEIHKSIDILGRSLVAKQGSWNYRESEFPACKIDGSQVVINKDYPLFSGVKHTDIFVRFHLILLIKYQDGEISESLYTILMDDFLKVFDEYL